METDLAALSETELADWHQQHVAPLLVNASNRKRRWLTNPTPETEAAFDLAAAEFQAVHRRWLKEVELRISR